MCSAAPSPRRRTRAPIYRGAPQSRFGRKTGEKDSEEKMRAATGTSFNVVRGFVTRANTSRQIQPTRSLVVWARISVLHSRPASDGGKPNSRDRHVCPVVWPLSRAWSAASRSMEFVSVHHHFQQRAITAFASAPNHGLIVTASTLALADRELIVSLAARHKFPLFTPTGRPGTWLHNSAFPTRPRRRGHRVKRRAFIAGLSRVARWPISLRARERLEPASHKSLGL